MLNWHVNLAFTCNIWGFHRGNVQELGLLGCYALLVD